MAIPSMSRSRRLTEVSTLLYLDEGTSTSGTECGEESDLQPRVLKEPQTVRVEDTRVLNIMPKGERGQSL